MSSVSREELYELAWSEPMTKIAERFEVSSSYLARVYSVLNVPRPERGYWAKHAVGKAPPQVPLPDARPGDELVWSRYGELPALPTRARVPSAPRTPAASAQQPRSQATRKLVTGVHGLISGAKAHFLKTRSMEEGEYLKPYKKYLVDILASQTGLDKALLLANDVFNSFESGGHRVILAPASGRLGRATIEEREKGGSPRDPYRYKGPWSPDRATVAYIGEVAIGLAVVEMSEDVLLRYVRGKYIRDADYVPPKSGRHQAEYTFTTNRERPSGRLRIVAYSPYPDVDWSMKWDETKQKELGTSLKAIVKAAEAAVPELITCIAEADRKAELAAREREAQWQKYLRQEDQRRIAQSVKESREQLGQVIAQWSDVMRIEQFFTGVEVRAASLSPDDRRHVLDRLNLARAFLGSQNPLDFFQSWKTPLERYQPAYPDETDDSDKDN